MVHRWPFRRAACVAAVLLSGCRSEVSPPVDSGSPPVAGAVSTAAAPGEPAGGTPPAPNELADPAPNAESVALRLVGTDGLAELLERHRGKVLFVDYWATWCVPCIQEFPRTVQLHAAFAERGLAVAAVSLDDPEQREEVLRFLVSQQATFDNLLCEAGTSDATFRAFGIPGPIPFYQLDDRQGRLRFRFSPVADDFENTQPLTQIELRVRELLAEES